MKKVKFFMILALLLSVVLSSCAAPSVPPTPVVQIQTQIVEKQVTAVSVQTQIVEKQVTPTPLPVAQAGGEIAVIVKTGNSSFWQNVQTGAFAAAKELKGQTPKLSVTFLGAQSESNINEQINIVQSAIDRGVKAIVLAPSDVTALVPAVKAAKDAGIPVVIIDSLLSGDTANYVSFLATDNNAAGQACAKALIAAIKAKGLKEDGKIAIMSYVKGVGSEIGRVGGFTDYIQKNSKLQIVTTQYSNADMPTALNQTTNVLAANPDLVGIFGANEPTAIGMGRAIVQAKLGGKIAVIGFDGAAAEAAFVKDGTFDAIAVQSSFNMGYLGVKTAYDVAFGGKKVDAKVDTGFLMVTKDNVDSQDAKNVLY
jgi:ribose transport system substrate-binding protein